MCGSCYPRLTEQVNHPLIPGITQSRLDTFFHGPYASQHLDQHLDLARYDGAEFVRMTYWSAPGDTKPSFDEGAQSLQAGAKELRKGFKFGPSWTNHWVKVDLTIPDEVRKVDQDVIFEFDPSSEGLIFALDSTPLHAITGGPDSAKDGQPGQQADRRVEHIIPRDAVKKGTYSIIIEVSCNGMFGVGTDGYRYQVPEVDRQFPLTTADIVVPNYPVRDLRTDFMILRQVTRTPDAEHSSLAQRALKACNDIMSTFRAELDGSVNVDTIARCRKIAAEVLGDLSAKGLEGLVTRDTKEREGKIWAIGHCHIDTAWLWRYTQTQQKIARSWTTQCDIMDRWQNHQFAASSAQQYLWLETLYPKGFERVKSYVKQGRFHVVGGAWLEHDCMIPSGESLVRQYLYGQRYFKSRFGEYCKEAWLPDTFGYASQLPQILRGAGLDWFFTQKLSWNNINKFPYSSFNWCGLDGTQVLAHMTPVDSYNAQCNYDEILKGARMNKNLTVTDQCLLLFGNGDGGGGPTPNMVEKLERLASLADHNPEVPGVKIGGPSAFFEDLCRRTDDGKKLPTWRGELYFEFHRGTYTTQANVKKGNRQMETLLRDLEYLATLASLKESKFKYPKEALDEMWQDTMLNQFHDCLPGTTIAMVVDDILDIHEKRGQQARKLIDEALQALVGSATIKAGATASEGSVVVDPLRIERSELYSTTKGVYLLETDASGLGALSAAPSSLQGKASAVKDGSDYTLSNAQFKLTISSGGRVTSLVDLSLDRELITPGPGTDDGGLMLYEDHPLRYDAWDAEIYHLDNFRVIAFDEVTTQVEGEGLRASLVARAKFGKSTATITFSLDAVDPSDSSSGLIRVKTEVDWHEKHKFLKFALPVDIHAVNATYATQFGVCQRPTHRNTTHDQAKFECCGHGFVDVSEAAYGVALFSRNKYGYAVEGNTMRLSMLRSSTTPDPRADEGEHTFEWAIMPHRGGMVDASVVKRAMAFNNEVYVLPPVAKAVLPTFVVGGAQSDGIVLETIKRSEDDEKAILLRMFESVGGRAKGVLKISGLTIKSAEWVDLLERPLVGEVKEACALKQTSEGAEITVNMRCFEIKSLMLKL